MILHRCCENYENIEELARFAHSDSLVQKYFLFYYKTPRLVIS